MHLRIKSNPDLSLEKPRCSNLNCGAALERPIEEWELVVEGGRPIQCFLCVGCISKLKRNRDFTFTIEP